MSTPRSSGGSLPRFITPTAFLMIATAMNSMSFASWQSLINNFGKDSFGASGYEIGLQQSIREIPGLLAFTAIFCLVFVREQRLAVIAVGIMGIGIALTGFVPSALGFYVTTLIMSVGFHYYEKMNQSLSLQWFSVAEAPVRLGRIMSASAFAQILGYGLIFALAAWFHAPYVTMFLSFGGLAFAAAVYLGVAFPHFPQKVVQRSGLVMRRRYWLYYALNFMTGARRQIFTVFAAWLMVERFNYRVEEVAALFLINCVFNLIMAPKIGGLILRFGERAAIVSENFSLMFVFIAYALVENANIAAALYVIDNAFFSLSIAQKTYFQKIADSADIAPTAGVAFSINHIAAVFIPFLLGLLWLESRSAVFYCGAGFAAVSMVLGFLIPRQPGHGRETAFSAHVAAPAE